MHDDSPADRTTAHPVCRQVVTLGPGTRVLRTTTLSVGVVQKELVESENSDQVFMASRFVISCRDDFVQGANIHRAI